jgi:hypothetical protein
VCHCIRAMFRVLGMYNFARFTKNERMANNFLTVISI